MQLHRDRDRFEAAGVNLVLVGHGTPAQAAHFREQYGVELPLLVDSDRRAYAAAGAGMASRGQLYGPGVVMRGFYRGVKAGIVQGRTQGDAAQLGGVLVVATDGTVVWSHLSEDASDNPPNDEVLKGVEAAVARS